MNPQHPPDPIKVRPAYPPDCADRNTCDLTVVSPTVSAERVLEAGQADDRDRNEPPGKTSATAHQRILRIQM